MRRNNIDSLLWVAVVVLCSAPACGASNAPQTTEGQSAALTNAMDDDSDGRVDEGDEGMDEDEDGTVDETHEHSDMCLKRHRDGRASRHEHSDGGVADGHHARGDAGADVDVDDSADEAAEHAGGDRDDDADESDESAAAGAGGPARAGAEHDKRGRGEHQGNMRERIDAIDCTDVPDTTTVDAGN